MSILHTRPFAHCATPAEALDELCAPFRGYQAGCGGFEEVAAEEMPQPYRQLLAHQGHMTVVLQEFHRTPVNLYVMEMRRREHHYSRKIFLTAGNTSDAAELGVVRLDLRCVRALAREEILEARQPLGAILIKHKHLMRVEPRWFLRFDAGSPVLDWFGYPVAGPFYGRIGTIWCNDEPAIELLEIATLWEAKP